MNVNRPDPVAVRQVSALVTAFLAGEGPEALHEADFRALYDEVLMNAELCMPIFLGHVGALVTELAMAEQSTTAELWQQRSFRLAAHYPEGEPS